MPPQYKMLSAAITGGVLSALYGWTYLAWHLHAEDSPKLRFHDEGWFGVTTYAGGADKVGHMWGNYAITRGLSGILEWGGWGKRASLITATGTTMAFFMLTELKDGYTKDYGFSWADVAANFFGSALGVLFEISPTLDRALDFRLEYWPSKPFRKSIATKGPYNSSEDYTGQRFFFAYHLSSIGLLRESKYLGLSQYLDISLGFHASHFKPDDTDSEPHTQEVFLGISLDLQRIIENTLMPSSLSGRLPSTGARVLHFTTEIYQVPFTTLKVAGFSRSRPDPLPGMY